MAGMIPSEPLGQRERLGVFDLSVQVALLQARGWRDVNDDVQSLQSSQQSHAERLDKLEDSFQSNVIVQTNFISTTQETIENKFKSWATEWNKEVEIRKKLEQQLNEEQKSRVKMEHQFHQMLMDMQGKFQEALETKVERGLTALELKTVPALRECEKQIQSQETMLKRIDKQMSSLTDLNVLVHKAEDKLMALNNASQNLEKQLAETEAATSKVSVAQHQLQYQFTEQGQASQAFQLTLDQMEYKTKDTLEDLKKMVEQSKDAHRTVVKELAQVATEMSERRIAVDRAINAVSELTCQKVSHKELPDLTRAMLDPVEVALMKSLSTMNDALHVVQRDWLEKVDKVQPFVDYKGNFQEDVQVAHLCLKETRSKEKSYLEMEAMQKKLQQAVYEEMSARGKMESYIIQLASGRRPAEPYQPIRTIANWIKSPKGVSMDYDPEPTSMPLALEPSTATSSSLPSSPHEEVTNGMTMEGTARSNGQVSGGSTTATGTGSTRSDTTEAARVDEETNNPMTTTLAAHARYVSVSDSSVPRIPSDTSVSGSGSSLRETSSFWAPRNL